jgi:hypothetical protein
LFCYIQEPSVCILRETMWGRTITCRGDSYKREVGTTVVYAVNTIQVFSISVIFFTGIVFFSKNYYFLFLFLLVTNNSYVCFTLILQVLWSFKWHNMKTKLERRWYSPRSYFHHYYIFYRKKLFVFFLLVTNFSLCFFYIGFIGSMECFQMKLYEYDQRN